MINVFDVTLLKKANQGNILILNTFKGAKELDLYLYFFFTCAYIFLFVWSLYKKQLFNLSSFVYLVIIGLIFDNIVVALGRFIGVGTLLENLNYLRYWVHAFVTPTLILFCLSVLQHTGIKWVKSKITLWMTWLYTIILILLEIFTEAWDIQLKPVWEYGVLRYIPAESASGPPIMIIFISITLIATAILLYKYTKWKWMLIGSVIMTIGSAIPFPFNSAASTNGFELFLLITLVITKLHFDKKLTTE